MFKLVKFFVIVSIIAALALPVGSTVFAAYAGIPTFSITSVVTDTTVTITTANFPAGYDFKVLMGKFGTLGVGGTQVATTASGNGGAITATYDIPAALKGQQQIAIRLESTKGGFYAYNWFWNNTSGGGSIPTTGGTGSGDSTGYTGIPTFSIASVVADSKVSIKPNNFPANREWRVLIGKYGTLGVGGTQVATVTSANATGQTLTYDIPAALKGQTRLSIRLESTTGGYFAYNWFDNATATPGGGTGSGDASGGTGYKGIPTFSITSVVADSKVTITTANLPAGYDFKVLMGKFGTLGVGGTQVATTASGNGGAITATYDIPAALKGQQLIAIRLESTKGGFYAYNWFWNNTAP